MIAWEWQAFHLLSVSQLYEILAARQTVFIVEQRCAFLDADGLDRYAWHLSGRNEEGHLLAYLRVVHPGANYAEPTIGRVITVPPGRGKGIGKELMREGIRRAEETYPGQGIRIAAQCYLEKFYRDYGFQPVGKPFDEDGIQHIEMLRPPRMG